MGKILSQAEIEKDLFEVKINFSDLEIDKDKIALTLGYTEGKIPPHFSEIIDDIISKLPVRCKVKAGYKICNVNRPPDRLDGLLIDNIFFKLDKIVSGQLKKSEMAAVFICTIGYGMEKWAGEMNSLGDPAASYFIDTVASAAVESAVDILHDHIGTRMHDRGLKITNRYSPGYCNWNVSEQHLLFSLLPKNFCGISLTESALMMPVKSVSGIIGIGRDVKLKKYICDKCGVKDCTYRTYRLTREKRIKDRTKFTKEYSSSN